MNQNKQTPLSKQDLCIELAKHLATTFGVPLSSEAEFAGLIAMANSFLDYFAGKIKEVPSDNTHLILWIIMSALWDGKHSQSDITAFFSAVCINPEKIFKAWTNFNEEEKKGPYTVAIIPGNLADADISNVARVLFATRCSNDTE